MLLQSAPVSTWAKRSTVGRTCLREYATFHKGPADPPCLSRRNARVPNRVPTTQSTTATTTVLGRTENLEIQVNGKSGKGRAAKRRRREREEALRTQEQEQANAAAASPQGQGASEEIAAGRAGRSGQGEQAAVKTIVKITAALAEPLRPDSPRMVRPPSPAHSVTSTTTSHSSNHIARRPGPTPHMARTPLAELRTGERREGATVTGVMAFGAFVDVGAGKDGLLPMRELPEGVAVGQKLAAVYIRHVDLAQGRLSISRLPLGNGAGERSRSESRASNTSSDSVESRASRRSVGSRLSHASTARTSTREEQRGAAFEAISAALKLWPDAVCFTATVINLTDFGVFVRLDVDELAKVMDACHADGIISVAAPPGGVRVDGLLRQRELVAGYRAGVIGAAGEEDGVAVGRSLRVRISSVDVQQRQLQLSLLAAPSVRPGARPIERIDRFQRSRPQSMPQGGIKENQNQKAAEEDPNEDARVPSQVDNETLASRLLWQPQAATGKDEAPPLAMRTLRRLPHGSFRTIRLVALPWKADVKARLPQHPTCACAA